MRTTDTKVDPLEVVRASAEAFDKAHEIRDAAIRDAHEAGCSFVAIATAAGLSHPGVMKIVKRPA